MLKRRACSLQTPRRAYAQGRSEGVSSSRWRRAVIVVAAIPAFGYLGYWTSFQPPFYTLAQSDAADIVSIETEGEKLAHHPYTESLRRLPTFRESRPHLRIRPQDRRYSLTAGTLIGLDKVTTWPIVFSEPTGKQLYVVTRLGKSVADPGGQCVHEGLLATVLDEGLARCCFPALPHKIGVS